jgi:hypothetical protein
VFLMAEEKKTNPTNLKGEEFEKGRKEGEEMQTGTGSTGGRMEKQFTPEGGKKIEGKGQEQEQTNE